MKRFIASLGSNTSSSGGAGPLLPNISFLAFGDIQYTNGTSRGTPRQFMTRDGILLGMANHPGLQFAVNLGDYGDTDVNTLPNQYGELELILKNFSGDWYNPLGNHDVRQPSKNTPQDISAFYTNTNVFKNFDSLHTRGYAHEKRSDTGLHVIVLNNMENANQGASGGNAASGHFYFTTTQVDWLQSVLDGITESHARIIVLVHAPLKSDTFNSGALADWGHEQTQADLVIDMLIDWQHASNQGLVLGVFNGHTHVNGTYLSETANGKLNHFSFDELDLVQNSGAYTGDATTVSQDPTFMAFGHVLLDERGKFLKITGYGQQASYLIDMSDRIY